MRASPNVLGAEFEGTAQGHALPSPTAKRGQRYTFESPFPSHPVLAAD